MVLSTGSSFNKVMYDLSEHYPLKDPLKDKDILQELFKSVSDLKFSNTYNAIKQHHILQDKSIFLTVLNSVKDLDTLGFFKAKSIFNMSIEGLETTDKIDEYAKLFDEVCRRTDEYAKLFDEVCRELKALDSGAIQQCRLQAAEYDPKASEVLGKEIQSQNRRDPLCRLVRADAAQTLHLLQTDATFRRLAFRTVIFNTSRDAALRLKAGCVSSELIPLFQKFEEAYENYISEPVRPANDLYVFELLRLYMGLITYNNSPDEAKDGDLYKLFANYSLNKMIQIMRGSSSQALGYDTVRKYNRLLPVMFIPTYAPLSIRTIINGWAAGIFFFGCTSNTYEEVHGARSTPEYFFHHDELHLFLYQLGDFQGQYTTVQKNAQKVIRHTKALLQSEVAETRKIGAALEFVLFLLHHEIATPFTRDKVMDVNYASLLTGLNQLPKEYVPNDLSDVNFAFNYYRIFANVNFK